MKKEKAGEKGKSRTERAFANSNHMEDRKGATTPGAVALAIRQMDITGCGSYALLAVSSRRSCINRGKRDSEETNSEGERQGEERETRREARRERGEVNGVETNLKILLQGVTPPCGCVELAQQPADMRARRYL